VCFAILLIDEASGFAEVYGINKNDLVDALPVLPRRSCQGHAAPQFARFDAGSEVTRHGELTQAFRQACQEEPQHHNLTISTGESEDQPGERGWQTIRRMANMFLQQENLIKQQWLAVLFAAVVMDRTLCHGDNDRSACEMMCGFIPNMAHVQILCGQTVMFPAILRF
jgi:hypothetical protein